MTHESVTVSQQARYKNPKTGAAEGNSAIIDFNILHLCFSYCDMSKCILTIKYSINTNTTVSAHLKQAIHSLSVSGFTC